MTYKQFIRRTIKIFQDPEMTLVMGTAVALGVVYACVAPWFYCKSDKPEDESQARCNPESDSEISSANQTLTSTNIRVTGLRGLNFVSITLPNQPSVSGTTGHSSEAPSRTKTSIQQSNNGEICVENPAITHSDMTQRSTIPDIHISSASTDTTTYPLSSKTSSNLLTAVRTSTRHRRISTDSNNSRYDVIRSHNDEHQNSRLRRLSQSKIRKSLRAQPSNARKSYNSIRKNRDSSSSSKTFDKTQPIEKKKSDFNGIATSNHFIDRRNSRSCLEKPDIVERTSLSDQQTRHSLYPDVNIVVRTNNSLTSFPSSSEIHQNLRDAIQKRDMIAEYPEEYQKTMESHSSLVDDFLSTVEDIQNISAKSRNKSAFTNFFKKKCKKFWMNGNKSNNENGLKLKCSNKSSNKNDPTGHSTPMEKSNYSSEVQGHSDQHQCETGIGQEGDGNCHHENLDTDTNYKAHIQNFVRPRISCCFTPNLYATQSMTMSSTSSKINSQLESTKHRSLPCRTNFEGIDDEPLDLSTKSRVNQSNSEPEKDSNNNCASETSFMSTFKKRTSFIFTKTFNKKLYSKKKSRSLPERDEFNILRSITQFCHRSQQDEDEAMRTHISDSTHYPELESINKRRYGTPSGFLSS